jgi:hypothetical protein
MDLRTSRFFSLCSLRELKASNPIKARSRLNDTAPCRLPVAGCRLEIAD